MRELTTRIILGPAFALALFPALAQSAPAATRESERPEVFGGFSFTQAGEANLKGWEIAGSVPFRGAVRLGVDLAGHYGSFSAGADLSQLTALAGPSRSWRLEPVQPFARVLLGALRSKTSFGRLTETHTNFAASLGGGIDYPFSSTWSARAQAELVLVRANGDLSSDPRLGIGAVYRFGR